MKKFLLTLLVAVPTLAVAQCSTTFSVTPVNMWEDVFTYEVDQIFEGNCHQAVQPVTVDNFSMIDIKAQKSTFIITVTDNNAIVDKFVINPGPKVEGCTSWVTESLSGNLTNLSIK